MGSGASRAPAVGVPANPRIIYTDSLSKKEKQTVVMDSSVLVDLQHGSVRYRYGTYEGEPTQKAKRIEKPYEKVEQTMKQHYFYHPRLKDFGQGSDRSKEDDFKFLHVVKGPARAQQKKLYYVYGRGLHALDGTKVKPTQTKEEGSDYSWPGLRIPNHLYYKLVFSSQGMSENTSEEPQDIDVYDFKSTPDKSLIRLTLTNEERAGDVRAKLAIKILKAASDLHICVGNLELRDEDFVGEYREEKDRDRSQFDVELHLI